MIPITSREWLYIYRILLTVKYPPDDVDIDKLLDKARRSKDLQERREALNATSKS